MMKTTVWCSVLYVALTCSAPLQVNAENPVYSPYANRNFPENLYWGETHLHSAVSADAYSYGARLGLEEAYRFARGEQVTTTTGLQARLGRPLDFLVIADHAQYLGVYQLINEKNPTLLADGKGRKLYEAFQKEGVKGVFADFGGTVTSAGGDSHEDLGQAVKELVWQRARGPHARLLTG